MRNTNSTILYKLIATPEGNAHSRIVELIFAHASYTFHSLGTSGQPRSFSVHTISPSRNDLRCLADPWVWFAAIYTKRQPAVECENASRPTHLVLWWWQTKATRCRDHDDHAVNTPSFKSCTSRNHRVSYPPFKAMTSGCEWPGSTHWMAELPRYDWGTLNGGMPTLRSRDILEAPSAQTTCVFKFHRGPWCQSEAWSPRTVIMLTFVCVICM